MRLPHNVRLERVITPDGNEYLYVQFWYEEIMIVEERHEPRELGTPELTRAMGDWMRHPPRTNPLTRPGV
jgi:hypothetical protein